MVKIWHKLCIIFIFSVIIKEITLKKKMKISRFLLTVNFLLGGGIIPIMYVDAGYLNSAGGNIYGDSDINPMADPDINPMADPDINPMADPDINPCADPYISPMGC